MSVTGLNHLTLAVLDIDVSVRFYAELLGLKKVMQSAFSAYLDAGGFWIALVLDERCGNDNATHVAFGVEERDFDALVARLMAYPVVEWQKNVTEGQSFYFLDPSGNRLEVHVGDMRSRVEHGRLHWKNRVRWFG